MTFSSANDAAWKPVKIGAGGWITSIDVAPDGTMVARTDTYGAYLWTGTAWKQLATVSSMPSNVFFSAGVFDIRIAPSNSKIMYMEMNDGLYKTVDKGGTWTKTAFPVISDNVFQSRTEGQRIAIDPTNPNVVFAGTPKDGLWVSRDGGGSWDKITAVPAGTNTNAPGLSGIVMKGSTIYVGTAGSGVYSSTDGGYNWKAIGGPADVTNAALSPDGSYYATGGGSLWKYANGGWTKLVDGSVHAVAIDPFNPARIVVTNGGGSLNLSTNAGAAWSGWNHGNQLESSNDIPWLETAELYMSSGNLLFDPLTPGKLWQSAGTGVWTTQLPSDLLWNTPVVWNSKSAGIEQLVANEVLAPAGGNPVFASWDRAFFESADLDSYATKYSGGTFSAGWSIDYASSSPNFIVGISDWWGSDHSGYSADGGRTWQKFAALPSWALNSVGGSIAASTPNNIIWAPSGNNAPAYTLDGGKTWATITIPGKSDWSQLHQAYYLDRTTITADRVLPNTFYLFDSASGVYRTTDGGVNWTKMFSGQPAAWSYWHAKIEAVPGKAGELFFTSGPQGGGPTDLISLMHSKDGGATWQAVPGVQAGTFGYGAPAVAGGPATVYMVGKVNNVYGIWYSTDGAGTWTQIGQRPMGSLDAIRTISGDMDQFGKVYVGFGGSGYAYLDFANAQPTTPVAEPKPAPTQTIVIADALDEVGGATIVGHGALINDSTPTLRGSISAPLATGQTIAVYLDGKKIGVASVSNGSWTFTDPGAPEGRHDYTAQVEDAAGNKGALSAAFSLIIDTVAPGQQPAITSALDDFGSLTGSLASGATTDDSSPLLQGSLTASLGADEKLAIYRDGVKIGQATVSGTQWTYADSNVAAGSRIYTASVEDAAGNAGQTSFGFALSVQALSVLNGSAGNDVLTGTSRADIISGVPATGTRIGKGTIDVLTGNGGADLFILGDSRGRFYDDARGSSSGTSDYARITDFGADDKLQLKGSAAEYFQAWRTIDGRSGTAVYHDSNGNGVLDSRDELIVLVQNYGTIDLTGMVFI